MVEPMSDEERSAGNLKLKVVFVLLVAVSAVGVTLQADPTAAQVGGAALGGLAVGFALSWYLGRTLREFKERSRR